MNAKQYLQQPYEISKAIKDKQKVLDTLKETLVIVGAIDYSKERVQGGSHTNAPYENIVIKIADLEREIEKDKKDLGSLQLEMTSLINATVNTNHSVILIKRDVHLKNWKQIAREMHFSISHCKRLHREAIDNLKLTEVDTQ